MSESHKKEKKYSNLTNVYFYQKWYTN